MITINEFSENVVSLIKSKVETEWSITAELGELVDNKDKIAYFTVNNQNPLIHDNATLQLDCEFVGTLLFENRTLDEVKFLCNDLYEAALQTIKGIDKYEELECGVVWLGCNPMMPQTETDEMYYSFKLPLIIYAQF